MTWSSFGLKISAISSTSLSERTATSAASISSAGVPLFPLLLSSTLPAFVSVLLSSRSPSSPWSNREDAAPPGVLLELEGIDSSRQPMVASNSSQETESRTFATAARVSAPEKRPQSGGRHERAAG